MTATPTFATELERELYGALAEIMASLRAYTSVKYPAGLARVLAAERKADTALAHARAQGEAK